MLTTYLTWIENSLNANADQHSLKKIAENVFSTKFFAVETKKGKNITIKDCYIHFENFLTK